MKTLSDNNKSVNSVCDEFAASKHAELVKNAISNEIYYVSGIIHNIFKIVIFLTTYINKQSLLYINVLMCNCIKDYIV